MDTLQTPSNSTGKSKAIQKYQTREDVEKFLATDLVLSCNPNQEIKVLAALLNEYYATNKDKRAGIETEVAVKALSVSLTLGVQTHALLAESVEPRYRPLVIELANQLIKEFQCTSHSERALAQVAAGSYARFMSLSKKLDHVTAIESASSEKNGYYGMIGREVDRAERRFLSAIMALKQIKSPTMNLQFKVGTAFVAQNQEINTSLTPNTASHETIVAK